jgi:hypothetical protein
MMDWFMAGGFGMWVVLAIGASAIGYGVKAVREPTAERVSGLGSFAALLVTSALFTFGTNMWAVNKALSSDSFMKARGLAAADLPLVGIMGITEATQALTLGGLLAVVVLVLRMVVEARRARG